MIFDAAIFKIPTLNDCYNNKNEIMDVFNYYTRMLNKRLAACEDIVKDNIYLMNQNEKLMNECTTTYE